MHGLVVAALLAPVAAFAQAQPSAPAQEFARLYLPGDHFAADAEAAFRKEAARAMDASPQRAAARYPALRQAALDAGAQATRSEYGRGLPAIQARIATAAAAAFTAAELGELNAFLRSDAGRAMQGAIRANIDSGRVADVARSRGTGTLTPDDLAGSVDLPGALGALTPAQVAAVAAFSSSPTGQKMQRFSPQLLALITEETNRLVQATGPKVQAAMLMAMRAQAAPAAQRKER